MLDFSNNPLVKNAEQRFILALGFNPNEARDVFGRWIGGSIKKTAKELLKLAPKKKISPGPKAIVAQRKRIRENLATHPIFRITQKQGTAKRAKQALNRKGSTVRKEVAKHLLLDRKINKGSLQFDRVQIRQARKKVANAIKAMRKQHYWQKYFQKANVDVLVAARKAGSPRKKSKTLKLAHQKKTKV